MRRVQTALSLGLGIALCLPLSVAAQVSTEEHAKHHPAPAGSPQSPPATSTGTGAMSGMADMMQGMGTTPPKELYPRLIGLPTRTPEQLAELQSDAHARMESGTRAVSDALQALQEAAARNDYAAMQDAVGRMREGIARFDSGLAAHRAAAEGASPQQIALEWFKRELNLPMPAPPMTHGWLGWSLWHWTVMVLLIGFAVVMVLMYVVKMRRAAVLLARLTEPPPGAVVAVSTPTPPVTRLSGIEPQSAPPAASVSDRVQQSPSTWSGSLRVASVFDETPGIKTFRLVNPTGGPVPFEFLPGQFLTLAVSQAGSTTKRSYTIASSAEQRGYVEITVKREEKGVVSRYLHDRVTPGDLLQVAAPQGRFTFTGAEADGIVLIGGGVGITPLMSVVRSLTDRGWDKDIFLLFACRTSADFVFREELERLQKRHPNLHVVATMSRADGTAWMGPTGRMTKEFITQSVPEIARRRVHLCGPATMMDATRAMLLELGVPGEQIRTEAFGPAGSKGDRQATVQAAMVEPSPATPVVAFTISNRSAPLPAGTSVLEAAEHVGVAIDNSCRAGTCGQCKVRLRKGSVTMAVQDALSPEEKASGIVLACQAQATTNLEVEA